MAPMLPPVLQVALGGALGATLRWSLGVLLARPGFPVAVLTANVVGGFAMGAAVVWLGRQGLGHWAPFLTTGLLGGFTTFSAFGLEAVTLYERGALGQAGLYVLLSVAGSLAALMAGLWVARGVLP